MRPHPLVEHAAVNRGVVGSSPTRGVDKRPVNVYVCGFFMLREETKRNQYKYIQQSRPYLTFHVSGSSRDREGSGAAGNRVSIGSVLSYIYDILY